MSDENTKDEVNNSIDVLNKIMKYLKDNDSKLFNEILENNNYKLLKKDIINLETIKLQPRRNKTYNRRKKKKPTRKK